MCVYMYAYMFVWVKLLFIDERGVRFVMASMETLYVCMYVYVCMYALVVSLLDAMPGPLYSCMYVCMYVYACA